MTDQVGGGEQENKKQKMSLADQLAQVNFVGVWAQAGLIPNKYVIDRETGYIMFGPNVAAPHMAPWIYVNPDLNRSCEWFHELDNLFNIIPKKCLHCWKVVVVPQTVKQLFKLYEIELQLVEKEPFCFCKCGTEHRAEVERNYGGYFYHATINEGLDRLDQLREIIYKEIGKIPVYLKRGCTEYERKYGDSSKWDSLVTPEWDWIEKENNKLFRLVKKANFMPDHVRNNVMAQWILFAADRGDPTVPDLNGGKKLFPGYVTYERPKLQEVPKDGK